MKDDYRDWLAANYAPATVNTQMSQARRLEREFGDLDEHYDRDRFSTVLAELKYTAADERAGKPSPTGLTAGASKVGATLAHLRGTLGFYRRFREGATRGKGWPELEQMRKRFLARCDDFRDFEQESGVYLEVERDNKDEVLEKFDLLLKEASKLDDRALGERALVLLQEKPVNFLSWRIFNDIQDAGDSSAGSIVTAIGAYPVDVPRIGDHMNDDRPARRLHFPERCSCEFCERVKKAVALGECGQNVGRYIGSTIPHDFFGGPLDGFGSVRPDADQVAPLHTVEEWFDDRRCRSDHEEEGIEPLRVCRRLQTLRGWSHDDTLFSGSAGACCSPGYGT